jgi:hypothetical protein
VATTGEQLVLTATVLMLVIMLVKLFPQNPSNWLVLLNVRVVFVFVAALVP